MKVSVCITVLNESENIERLLLSLLSQSLKPYEIIIVDGGSKDDTVSKMKSLAKKHKKIKLISKKVNRSQGRNIAIEKARSEIIAITDGGCVPQNDWLEKLTKPFTKNSDVSAGFYKMVANNDFEKSISFYLGVLPNKFDNKYLPSARSMAFRKSIWKKVEGFPESLAETAEDTVFNLRLIEKGAKITRVKNAIVEWGMPSSLIAYFSKIFNYAKGDAQSGIWIHPSKGLGSHNIKTLFVIFRYMIALWISILCIHYNLFPIILVLFFVYCLWAYKKVFFAFGENKVAVWGPGLQIVSDIGVILGFLSGLFTGKKRDLE